MPNSTPDWHNLVLKDYEETNMSFSELGTKYGRTAQTVAKLCYRSGLIRKNPNTRRGPKRKGDQQYISKAHQAIGTRLNFARGENKTIEFANQVGVSGHVLLLMEVGQHDFKLTELMRIAEITGLPIPELMKSFDTNMYQPRRLHGNS